MKNDEQPIRDYVPGNSQFTKDPCWLNNTFLFSTEIWAEQLKKPPCISGKICRKGGYQHMHSRTHTHTHPPSRWDFLTKKRFSPGKRGRFPHRRKQLAKNVAGKGRGKEMSLSRCLGLYYKLPKSDPNAVYLLPTAVYLLQCCFIAANIVWTG